MLPADNTMTVLCVEEVLKLYIQHIQQNDVILRVGGHSLPLTAEDSAHDSAHLHSEDGETSSSPGYGTEINVIVCVRTIWGSTISISGPVNPV